MAWQQTYTGRIFYPLSPRPRDIDPLDIAHPLSLQCRFNGHCLRFYSVAEHSVRVSRYLEDHHSKGPVAALTRDALRHLSLWGLLHDAAEAYLGDLVKPVKDTDAMRPFCQAEARLLKAVAKRFGLRWPVPMAVRVADARMLASEKRDLMVPEPKPWNLPWPPVEERINPWSPKQAKRAFLERLRDLWRGE